jgi:hypothetical protein
VIGLIILRGRQCHIIVLNVHDTTKDITSDVKDSFYEEFECVFDKFPKHKLCSHFILSEHLMEPKGFITELTRALCLFLS